MTTRIARLAILAPLLACTESGAFSSSPDGQPRIDASRRQLLSLSLGSAAPTWLLLLHGDAALATCLTGDEAVDCIGVYKDQLPDATADTRDTLEQSYGAFRPDRPPVVLPNPRSLDEAVGTLRDQLLALDDVERLLSAGKLEDAGVVVLRVLPRLTLAGRRLVAETQDSVPRIRQTAVEAIALASELDDCIGKALRGNLGSTTVAQLALLSDVRAVKTSLEILIERAL